MKDALLIGIDLGGTQIKSVLTNTCGDILHEDSRPTEDIPNTDNSHVWKASIKVLIQSYLHTNPGQIQAIGISSPGTINPDNTAVLSNGSKLLGIEDFVWADFIGQKVSVLNDAHAALFAESRLGAGKGHKDILMMTLGTGVGGAIMINGQILQGQMGRAGHIGHISVNQSLQQGIVQTPGSLEDSIGECTIHRRSYGRFSTTQALVAAYRQGDPFASWVWLNSIQALSRGMISVINVLSPELIILGGGISKAGSALMDPLKSFLDIYEWRPKGFESPIRFAKLSRHAGAVGAALFAWEQNQSP